MKACLLLSFNKLINGRYTVVVVPSAHPCPSFLTSFPYQHPLPHSHLKSFSESTEFRVASHLPFFLLSIWLWLSYPLSPIPDPLPLLCPLPPPPLPLCPQSISYDRSSEGKLIVAISLVSIRIIKTIIFASSGRRSMQVYSIPEVAEEGKCVFRNRLIAI